MKTRRQFLYWGAGLGAGLLLSPASVLGGYDPTWKPGARPERALDITVFEMFKIGPGPSSSHTIAPMKAGNDFLELMRNLPEADLRQADTLQVRLYGSLSDTGIGHGTHKAVTAGLQGVTPESATVEIMDGLYVRQDDTVTIHCGPLSLPFGMGNFIFEKGEAAGAPCSDVLRISLAAGDRTLAEREYYSVGGGFLQWKGWKAPERGEPAHAFDSMNGLLECMKATGKSMPVILMENETALTGMHPDDVRQGLLRFVNAMTASVENGLARSGQLKGPYKVERRANGMFKAAEGMGGADAFLARLSAYAHAAAEENSDGHPIVTAPTAGSAGVMPAVVYALEHERNLKGEQLVNGMLVASFVGMLAKRHASIAGADVGCQGEIGVASSMAAALAAHVLDGSAELVENAAELALEHHLGMTCDPVGGYVQIPCISRCAMGAVKAWNARVMARSGQGTWHPVGLDLTIRAMNATGRDMDPRYRETAKGGLALFYTGTC
ncbi:L-serine ammonia-lyase [Desulfovibrio sp. ZJ200]|uniref:L-serine ammonia-lyase n=1 Tax=Desulfovibrio sp. ZJ200 TaxID=2709792 RepID=UPI0013ED7595|nr:L-serine ammonia-lyase [Desulfovibrio sp. ZJ200]